MVRPMISSWNSIVAWVREMMMIKEGQELLTQPDSFLSEAFFWSAKACHAWHK